MRFKIDPEFRDLIPPLFPDELAQLEASILQDGIRDPLVAWQKNGAGLLVDGHHRWEIISRHKIRDYSVIGREFQDRNDVKEWIIDNQCGRRNLPRFTKCLLQLQKQDILRQRAKENQGKRTDLLPNSVRSSAASSPAVHVDAELSRAAGVSKETLQRVRFLAEHGDAGMLDALKRGQLSINEAFKSIRSDVRKKEDQADRKKRLREYRSTRDDDMGILHGDFREISKQRLDDNSVDLVLTDPPYDLDSVSLYGDLAKVAARVLKVGGSLVTFCGNRWLPEVLAQMTQHIRFYWTLACIHTGGVAHEDHRRNIGVINAWKPILWFVKEKRADRTVFVRDAIVSEMSKEFYDHGQGLVEARYLIEQLTRPNDLVFDPFCGGGTTVVAAKSLARRWLACDIEKDAVLTARARVVGQGKEGSDGLG